MLRSVGAMSPRMSPRDPQCVPAGTRSHQTRRDKTAGHVDVTTAIRARFISGQKLLANKPANARAFASPTLLRQLARQLLGGAASEGHSLLDRLARATWDKHGRDKSSTSDNSGNTLGSSDQHDAAPGVHDTSASRLATSTSTSTCPAPATPQAPGPVSDSKPVSLQVNAPSRVLVS